MSVQNLKIMFTSVQSPNKLQDTKNEDSPSKKQRQMRRTIPTSRMFLDSEPKTSQQFNMLSISMANSRSHQNANIDDQTTRRMIKNNYMDNFMNGIKKTIVKDDADKQIQPLKRKQRCSDHAIREETSKESLKESQGKSALNFLKNTNNGKQDVENVIGGLCGPQINSYIEEQSDQNNRQSSVIIGQTDLNIINRQSILKPFKNEDGNQQEQRRISKQSSCLFKRSPIHNQLQNNERLQSVDNIFKPQSSRISKSSSSSNIFEKAKKQMMAINKQKSQQSSSDDGNIFVVADKRQRRFSIKSSNSNTNYTLQKILLSSNIYANYLNNMQRRFIKKISIDVPQLSLGIKQLPKQFYFKPVRVEFRKITDFAPNFSSNSGYNYLCKVNRDKSRLFFQDLKIQQINNLNGSKCGQIVLSQKYKMSPNAEYDHINRRIYLFSNKEQKIFVYSQASLELLGQVPVQKPVNDPQLYFYPINGRYFLLVIGGYSRIQKQTVQGSKFIQIFEIHSWEVGLKSRIIKLIIGRISPVVLTVKQKNESRLLILGGNTIGKVNHSGQLSFDYETDINQSTNMTGISIPSHQIIELFDIEEHAMYSNLSVKMINPLCLHNGIVIAISNVFLLILPKCCYLFQAKIVNKQINIVQSSYVTIPEADMYQRRQVYLKIERDEALIYRINQKGILQIISLTNGQKIQRLCCSIY